MNEEIERLRKRIISLKDNAYQGRFVILNFYDSVMQEVIKSCFKNKEDLEVFFYGGYNDSDYKRGIIAYEEPNLEMFQISTLKINYAKKNYTLNHRMILGSVLGLGLKREVIGDIVENNGDFYLLVCKNIADFIIENMHYVGSASVSLEYSEINFSVEKRFLEKDCFLSSLRLDVVIAGFYNLSRKEALVLIQNGDVKVNHIENHSQATTLKVGDILSVRGKGRIILDELKGYSKSGNIILKIKKPI